MHLENILNIRQHDQEAETNATAAGREPAYRKRLSLPTFARHRGRSTIPNFDIAKNPFTIPSRDRTHEPAGGK